MRVVSEDDRLWRRRRYGPIDEHVERRLVHHVCRIGNCCSCRLCIAYKRGRTGWVRGNTFVHICDTILVSLYLLKGNQPPNLASRTLLESSWPTIHELDVIAMFAAYLWQPPFLLPTTFATSPSGFATLSTSFSS